MSDINDIPLELLLCVFCWCTVASADAPLQIAAVCHTWRTLALRTPELWTRLDLRFARSPNAEFPDVSETRAIEKSDVWMQRAMQSAVDVSITIVHQTMRLPMANFMFVPLLALPTPLVFSKTTLHDSPLAQRLSRRLPRIGALAICAPTELDVRAFMTSLYTAPAPSALTTLRLTVSGASSGPATPSAPPDEHPTEITPCASDVHVSNLALPSPWLTLAGLTHLTLTRRLTLPALPTAHILDVLEHSPHLHTLALHTRIADTPSDASLRPARVLPLPALHTLSLTANALADVLLALRTPALAALTLTDLDGLAPWTARALAAFLTARPPLRRLRLARLRGAEAGTWEWCLPRVPALARLELVQCAGGGEVLAVLRGGAVCPVLRELVLERCPGVYAGVEPWFCAVRAGVHVRIVDEREEGPEGGRAAYLREMEGRGAVVGQ